MPAGIIGEGYMILEFLIQEHMVEGILGAVERSCPVIISAQNPYLQEGIL